MGNLIGVLLGLAIGAAGIAVFLPQADAPAPSQPATAATAPIVLSPPPPPLVKPRPSAPRPQAAKPMELPRVAIVPEQPQTLPNVVYPDPPPAGSGGRRSGVAGTGFFVASDGTLLTAAHVVNNCRQTKIASRLVKPTPVELLASDTGEDIALLRAAHVKPPGILSVGRPASPGARLFVLGYPATAGPLIPEETWATLENDKLEPAPQELSDPRKMVWAAGPAIQHGYSGGPMLDPRNGEVVGIVRGMVDSTKLHAARASIPPAGMVIGPGSGLLSDFLQQQGAEDDASAETVSGDDALDTARRATVHVLCWQ
jgi:S1-C subfamily serine protease